MQSKNARLHSRYIKSKNVFCSTEIPLMKHIAKKNLRLSVILGIPFILVDRSLTFLSEFYRHQRKLFINQKKFNHLIVENIRLSVNMKHLKLDNDLKTFLEKPFNCLSELINISNSNVHLKENGG